MDHNHCIWLNCCLVMCEQSCRICTLFAQNLLSNLHKDNIFICFSILIEYDSSAAVIYCEETASVQFYSSISHFHKQLISHRILNESTYLWTLKTFNMWHIHADWPKYLLVLVGRKQVFSLCLSFINMMWTTAVMSSFLFISVFKIWNS